MINDMFHLFVIFELVLLLYLLDTHFQSISARLLFYFFLVPLFWLTFSASFVILYGNKFPLWPVHFDILSLH